MQQTAIDKGFLRKTKASFEVRSLEIDQIEEMLQLQEAVKQTVEVADQLQPLSKQEFEYILSGNGFILGTYVNQALIAFRAMLVPPLDDPDHLGTDAGLNDQDLAAMIYSEITVVHPSFRGNGLQTHMGKLVMEKVDKTRFRYVATTVAPFNIPSLKDKLALGLEIIGLKEKYNGKLRYILFKDFKIAPKSPAAATTTVAMGDTDIQQHLLKEGYRGTSIQATNGNHSVVYQR